MSDTELKTELAEIKAMLHGHLQRQSDINERLTVQAERHAAFIYGSDSSDSPGAKVRMDRLEQSEKRRTIISMSALTGVIALVVKQVWTIITSGSPPPH